MDIEDLDKRIRKLEASTNAIGQVIRLPGEPVRDTVAGDTSGLLVKQPVSGDYVTRDELAQFTNHIQELIQERIEQSGNAGAGAIDERVAERNRRFDAVEQRLTELERYSGGPKAPGQPGWSGHPTTTIDSAQAMAGSGANAEIHKPLAPNASGGPQPESSMRSEPASIEARNDGPGSQAQKAPADHAA